jgi:hypothetical protein
MGLGVLDHDFAMRICLRLGGPAKALLSSLTLVLAVGSLLAPPQAHGEQPRWTVSSDSSPTSFAPGDETGEDKYVLTVVNSGSGTTDGSPMELTDLLPVGVVASSISGKDLGNGQALTCRLTPTLGCTYEGFEIASGDVLQVDIEVNVSSGVASPAINSVSVTGGGAENPATIEDPTPISSAGAKFGISSFATTWSDTEAGATVNLTAGFTLNQILAGGETEPAASPRDVTLDLPPGFVVNPEHIQRCSATDAQSDKCQTGAAVGVAFTSSSSGIGGTPIPYSSLVYSTEPEPGELGRLMLMLPSGPIVLGLRVSASGGYHMQLQAKNLPEIEPLLSMTLTLWGIPGASPGPDHVLAGEAASFGGPGSPVSRFLASAGSCDPSPASRLSVTPWTEPAAAVESSSNTPSLTGCDRLPFSSSFSVEPDVTEASEPSGYAVDLHFSQSTDPSGFANADARNAAVALPEGVSISLSAADGLLACTEAQIGLGSQAPAMCPDASKVGVAEIETQLLSHPLQGAIYLAAQAKNPFGALLAVYIVAEEPLSATTIKLAGEVNADPVTGRLTLTLSELPRLPISGLHLHLFGGARALLTTPDVCGQFTSTSELTPWSANTNSIYSSSFAIDAGPNGGSCERGLFNPTFQVGGTVNGAGAYTSLVMLASRASGEEDLDGIDVQAPAAVASMFSEVPVCGEPAAAQGACPASSEVGAVAAAVGLGPAPYYLGGAMYLTGPYRGASQSLAIVIPFDAGPFTLGTIVVRAAVQIVPGSGQMTIVTDQLPTVVDGIPLHLGELVLQFGRGTFSLNPDGCEPLSVLATVVGSRGSSRSISATPFGEAPPCNTASSPASITHNSARQAPAGRLSLESARILTERDGRAIVKLRCTGTSPCRGKLTLTLRTKAKGRKRFRATIIGAAEFSIPPGDTRDIKVKLSATARFRLRANHGRLTDVRLKLVKSSPAPAELRTTDVSLVRESSRRRRSPTS